MKEIYLAGGCFWGVQHYFSQIPGIINTSVGYANGNQKSTTYQDLKQTHHAETIHLQYDENIISLRKILLHFYRIIDPTSLNKQGNDVGVQYRSGIYFTDENDEAIIHEINQEISRLYQIHSVVEILPLNHYILAEDYHQDYLIKNPNGYCHLPKNLSSYPLIDSADFTKDLSNLDTLSYNVTQLGATEAPFTNAYDATFEDGIYVDITTGEPLFSSKHKFASGCGWPAFHQSIAPEVITMHDDHSLGMQRIEVKSRAGNAHLGHVFNDGPYGVRFCINSASLKFIPKHEMEKEGYGELIPYV